MKRFLIVLLLGCMLSSVNLRVCAQPHAKIKANADLVSSFIWRGVPCYAPLNGQNILSPNIQPTLAYSYGNFEAGAWGSVDFTGSYKETDLYIMYSLKSVTLTLSDYYWATDWLTRDYFEYSKDSTAHILEGSLSFKPENFPLNFTLATMFYGADKKADDFSRNNYSTYFEMGYSLPVKDEKIDLALGITPNDGFYGDGYGGKEGFALVNISATGYKNIRLSEQYELPVKASVIANPQHNKIYMVFAISL